MRGLGFLAAVLALAAAAGCGDDAVAPTALAPPRLVAEAAGIDHRYEGDFQYFVGGGVAAFDCDDDGRHDLYFAGGAGPAALYRNESPVGGALRFSPVAGDQTDLAGVTGAYPLDVDSDGFTDLAVLRVGEDVLLRGLGDCRFERANEALGFDGGDAWTVAFSATWESAQQLPTLAFGDYLTESRETCEDSRLLRPSGARYPSAVPLAPGYCTLSMLFSDWSRTGQRDLRLTNDRHYYREGSDQLWRIVPGETPRPYAEADGWRTMQIWGMGIASHDLTGDGRPEVFLTSQGDNKLQTLAAGATSPTYEDIALRRGVTAHRPYTGGEALPSTAWHAEFADVNNDGFTDLFIAKGNVEAQEGYAMRDPSNLLIGQPDGTFVEGGEAAGIASDARARGGALVDLNLDGLLDLVVVNRVEPVTLWRNTSPDAGRWAAVRVRQPAPNVDAIGAWVETRAGDRGDVQEVTVGGGHAGGQLGWLHVGLGDEDEAEVRVQWPDGETGPWMTVDAGTFSIIERGADEPVPWTPDG